jgi:hypothetical protein
VKFEPNVLELIMPTHIKEFLDVVNLESHRLVKEFTETENRKK